MSTAPGDGSVKHRVSFLRPEDTRVKLEVDEGVLDGKNLAASIPTTTDGNGGRLKEQRTV